MAHPDVIDGVPAGRPEPNESGLLRRGIQGAVPLPRSGDRGTSRRPQVLRCPGYWRTW